MKLTSERPYYDPDKAARRLMEHAHAFEPIQDGRIYIEKINGPFLFSDKGTPAEYSVAGLKLATERGWLNVHESGTFVRLTQSGADLFAQRTYSLFAMSAYPPTAGVKPPNETAYRRATVIATARTTSQESAPIHPAESASHSNAPLGKRLKPNQLKPTSSEERTSTLTF
jgi:hypothetical protein